MQTFPVFPNELCSCDQHAVMTAATFVVIDLPWLQMLLTLRFLEGTGCRK